MMRRVLAVRQDNNGDVILAGPPIRAVAASGARVTLLCGPRGAAAGRMLPCVDTVEVFEAAWIDADPQPLDRNAIAEFVERVRAGGFDEAIIFTSFHQSPLPMALLLRLAEIQRIGAVCEDYPGSLLDVRHRVSGAIHEVRRGLSLARAMGYELPSDDNGALVLQKIAQRVEPSLLDWEPGSYVVVHPGATVPARRWYPEKNAALVQALHERGHRVVVTGSLEEAPLTAYVAGKSSIDLGGRTTLEEYAAIVRDAAAVVCGNTVASHVAAAMQTPVVCIFAPTIPAVRFHPWRVRHILLGDQRAPCAGCRARTCPIEGQPCLAGVTIRDVVAAVERLAFEATFV
jgi:ADP-heptose:LPS heptosyltransferase